MTRSTKTPMSREAGAGSSLEEIVRLSTSVKPKSEYRYLKRVPPVVNDVGPAVVHAPKS